MSTLQSTFEITFDRILTDRKLPVAGDWLRDQRLNFLDAAEAALIDSRKNRAGFHVCVAPKGAAKSTSLIAFAVALLKTDPDASMVIALPQVRLVEEVRREVAKYVEAIDLGVWTVAHCRAQGHRADTVKKYGTMPVTYVKTLMPERRLVITTHASLKGPDRFLFTRYKGKRRTLIAIDERPELMEVRSVTPSDVASLKEAVAQVMGVEYAWVQALNVIAHELDDQYMDGIEEHDEDGQVITKLFMPLAASPDCVAALDSILLDKRPDEVLASVNRVYSDTTRVISFLRLYRQGKAVRYLNGASRFTAADLDFTPEPGMLILDGTSHVDGVSGLIPWVTHHIGPEANYRDLTVRHIDTPPPISGYATTIAKSGEKREAFLTWVKELIIPRSKQGDRVLVVIPKAINDAHSVNLAKTFTGFDPTDGEAELIEGRKVAWLTWGDGIGQNRFRTANVVILVGEFHLPKDVYTTQTLAATGRLPSADTLSDAQSRRYGLDGDFKIVQQGHLTRWNMQTALRGAARIIDGETGVAQPMSLYTTGEFSRWSDGFAMMFPGAKIIKPEDAKKRTQKDGHAALCKLLLIHEGEWLGLHEAAMKLETPDLIKNSKSYLSNTRVQQAAQQAGLEFQRGTRTKPAGWRRVNAVDFGFTSAEAA